MSEPKQVTAAAVMVMPRSRSCSIQSVVNPTFVHFPDFVLGTGIKSTRSVVVVFPASICAMIPKFLTFLEGSRVPYTRTLNKAMHRRCSVAVCYVKCAVNPNTNCEIT